jgi:DNA-binding SARP family transcriptional activator
LCSTRRPSGAIRTYQELKSMLEEELGLDPVPQSEELYLTILNQGVFGDREGESHSAVGVEA